MDTKSIIEQAAADAVNAVDFKVQAMGAVNATARQLVAETLGLRPKPTKALSGADKWTALTAIRDARAPKLAAVK